MSGIPSTPPPPPNSKKRNRRKTIEGGFTISWVSRALIFFLKKVFLVMFGVGLLAHNLYTSSHILPRYYVCDKIYSLPQRFL